MVIKETEDKIHSFFHGSDPKDIDKWTSYIQMEGDFWWALNEGYLTDMEDSLKEEGVNVDSIQVMLKVKDALEDIQMDIENGLEHGGYKD